MNSPYVGATFHLGTGRAWRSRVASASMAAILIGTICVPEVAESRTCVPATASAGGPYEGCGSQCVQLDGSVGGSAKGGSWVTSGTGTFTPSSTALDAQYCPSDQDRAVGFVTLTLTTNDPPGQCGPVSSTTYLTLYPPAFADAGGPYRTCTDCVQLNGTVGGGATAAVWTTSGSGTFIPNTSTIDAVYCPSLADASAGWVNLALYTSDPAGPCPGASDGTSITILCVAPPVFGYFGDAEIEFGAGIPTRFGLYPSEPNPARSHSTLRFALPENSQVRIALYDIGGREIRVLADEVMERGYRTLGMDLADDRLARGIYFYRLDALGLESGARFGRTEKVLLVR